MKERDDQKLKVINIGLQSFYDAIESQSCKVIQLAWVPPIQMDPEILAILEQVL